MINYLMKILIINGYGKTVSRGTKFEKYEAIVREVSELISNVSVSQT